MCIHSFLFSFKVEYVHIYKLAVYLWRHLTGAKTGKPLAVSELQQKAQSKCGQYSARLYIMNKEWKDEMREEERSMQGNKILKEGEQKIVNTREERSQGGVTQMR